MAYSSLPTVVPGDPVRASWGTLVDANLDDHEARILDIETVVGSGGSHLGKLARVRVATTAAITIATGLNVGDTIDGITLAADDVVLVKDQASPAENGIYTAGPAPARAAEFTDFDDYPGAVVTIQEGTVGAGDVYRCTSVIGGTIEVDPIVFEALGAGVTGPGSSTDNAGVRFDGTGGDTVQAAVNIFEDDGRISTVTDPTGLQDAATKAYVDGAIAAATPGGGAAQSTFLVSGGQIAWITGYQFLVSAAVYYIAGVLYSSAEQSITLDAADATLNRIDLIAVDNTSTVIKVTGTPSTPPSEPDTDPSTQLKLGFVTVDAASSAPTVTNTSVYAENLGSGSGEWNWTTSGSGFNVNSTNNPRTGSKCIEGTTVANNAYAQGAIGAGTFDPSTVDRLVFYLRSKASWNNNRVLRVSLLNAGILKGTALTVATGFWGFDSAITGSYQLISIPIAQFAIPSGTVITQIRITDSGGSIGFYIDDVGFQAGGATGSTETGITQAQADARYAPLAPSYVTIATQTGLPNERVLTGSARVSVTDGGAGAAVTLDVPNDAIAYAKIQNVSAASRILGRGSAGGSGDVEELTISTGLTLTGTTLTATGSGGTGDVVGPSSSVDAEIALFDSTTGKLIKRATGTGFVRAASGVASVSKLKRTHGLILGDGTNVISTGVQGFISCPVAGTITKVRLLSSDAAVTSGSIVVDIWKDTYANYPPVVGDSITASAKPTITTATKSEDSTLTGWTTSVSAGDVFGFNVDSVTSLKRVTVELTIDE